MYRPVLIEPPVIFPVTLDEAKAWCRAKDFEDDDPTLAALISAATSYLDGWTGILNRALCEQTWRQDFDRIEGPLRLPLFPVISIASVKYTDADGVEQTVSTSDYRLLTDVAGSYVHFVNNYSSPSTADEAAAVRVAYVAGYADTPAVEADEGADPPVEAAPRLSTVPEQIKQAIYLLVDHWYENREIVSEKANQPLPFSVDALLTGFRRPKL